jgi:carbohydrate kinase (thermoresistant glucokinase family)
MNEGGKLFVVMGVSGCGKTTLGKALAAHNGLPFFDGDDYHTAGNIAKMSAGIALDDEDRKGWLERLNELLKAHGRTGAVVACSALKQSYRKILDKDLDRVIWVYLEGSYEAILDRLKQREGHYMPPSLLRSQFEALEPPQDAIRVPVGFTVAEALEKIGLEARS